MSEEHSTLSNAGESLFSLAGKVALVTGGNGGIGLSIARGLGRAGAAVVIVGRNQLKGDAAVQELAEAGIEAHFIQADVSDEGQVKSMIDNCLEISGRLDILVNNAGVTARKRPESMELSEWMTVMNVNLTSAFLCSRAAFPAFARQGHGKVINIGSLFSTFGSEFSVAYGSSKGGIIQFTRALAAAWGPNNVQANAILPGWIQTEMGSLVQKDPGNRAERLLARTPAGRWGRVEDLQGIAIFLASQASGFVTGAAIPVDGGFSSAG